MASKLLQKVKFENISNIYSISDDLVYDLADKDKKHFTYTQLAAYHSNGCFIAPLCDYAHNKIFQDLPRKSKYFLAPMKGKIMI